MNTNQFTGQRSSQRGAALFFAMMFLLVISIIALAASKTSILQEKMTGAVRNQQLALLGAESATRAGEQMLWTLDFTIRQPLPPCVEATTSTNCFYDDFKNGAFIQSFLTTPQWVEFTGPGVVRHPGGFQSLGGTQQTAKLASAPMYILQEMGLDVPPSSGRAGGAVYPQGPLSATIYRIIGRSPGGNVNSASVVESFYTSSNLSDTGHNPLPPPP